MYSQADKDIISQSVNNVRVSVASLDVAVSTLIEDANEFSSVDY